MTPEQIENLILEHIDLVKVLARKRRNWASSDRADLEDLQGEGYLALCEAAKTWREDIGPFKPYAIQKIKWALQRADEAATHATHVQYHQQRLANQIRQAMNAGATTVAAVSEATGLAQYKVSELWPYVQSNKMALTDDIQVRDTASLPEEQIEETLMKEALYKAIDNLPEIQKKIGLARFGFTTGEPMSLAQLEKFFPELTTEEIQEAEPAAMASLRAAMEEYR